ncbi:hypothetical protein N4T77_10225 [Clostridium sp. CX1]|uniref:RHS repeat-associated core domain-containing protein n=1 Tax=Clostridium sp. CX1 TaxID=2978346 RepID=UPI0021C0C4FC|nr:RHS repeat-associated core domain-containing protein [Clostridium sp. CX1]MCT8976980.1 hypothetical protein [Clostridium sp. CX1]
MTAWANIGIGGTGSRLIIANEGTNRNLFNVYVDEKNKLNLAVINNSNNFTNVITVDEELIPGQWYFVAVSWIFNGTTLKCSLYLNNKVYNKEVIDFRDFTGVKTAVGSNIGGDYALKGLIKKFSYSPRELMDAEILKMYHGSRVKYEYDSIGRVVRKKIRIGLKEFETQYGYEGGNKISSTTNRLSSVQNELNPINYSHDDNGNITKIIDNGKVIEYRYNELNELVKEINGITQKIIDYSYDAGGNIAERIETPLSGGTSVTTGSYQYDLIWKDKLTHYNGKEITHDNAGNPLTYNNYSYTWEEGRQLKSIVGNGQNISFRYNDAGIRTEKNVDGVVTRYYLIGNKVVLEDNGIDRIYYTYDSNDDLLSMNLNGEEYYYIRNGQGDIIGLFDKNAKQVVSYVYGTWGRLISIKNESGIDITNDKSHVGYKNSYRYRGYRYDGETEVYYLNSRYYNPEWGRYLNADALVGITGLLLSHNVFVYSMNNPVNMVDPNGYLPRLLENAIQGARNFAERTYNYVTDVAVEVKETVKNVVSSAINNFAFSSWKPLGHKDWEYRHDEADESTREREHVHLRGEGREYQQDIKGGRRKKQNPYGLPDPPKKVRKLLKEKGNWDWDTNASKNIVAKTLVISGGSYLIYRSIRMIPSLAPPLWWTIPVNVITP